METQSILDYKYQQFLKREREAAERLANYYKDHDQITRSKWTFKPIN